MTISWQHVYYYRRMLWIMEDLSWCYESAACDWSCSSILGYLSTACGGFEAKPQAGQWVRGVQWVQSMVSLPQKRRFKKIIQYTNLSQTKWQELNNMTKYFQHEKTFCTNVLTWFVNGQDHRSVLQVQRLLLTEGCHISRRAHHHPQNWPNHRRVVQGQVIALIPFLVVPQASMKHNLWQPGN